MFMTKFYLSTKTERTLGILFSLVVSAALVVLLIALGGNWGVFALTAIGALIIVAILAMYVLNVTKAACIPDLENNVLRITGVQERTIDLSTVACLETITVKSGHVEGRSLAFTNGEGNVVAIVPTYFTSKRGVLAEPMAIELAKALNIEFRANVPLWEYDEEARKAHEIEVEEQRKADAKARRENKKKLRIAKMRLKMENKKEDK